MTDAEQFPVGGVLVGYAEMRSLVTQFDWFTPALLVNPVEVWLFVFHGWLLFFVFIVSAQTGFGLEYTTDRESEEVARV